MSATPHRSEASPALPFTLVEDQPGLSALVSAIHSSEEVAMDTEADNQWHFRTLLCLMQIEVGGRIYLVDTLRPVDLRPLYAALAAKPLIMHGSDFDLRLMREAGGFRALSLFDTMIAAQLAGHSRFGLAALLEHYFQVSVSKKYQKANWSERPLTGALLAYAAGDAHYLRPLRNLLHGELAALGRLSWLEQRCAWQIEAGAGGFDKDEEQAWRLAGSDRLPPKAQAVLYELWHWRQAEAERLDTPPFKVLHNEVLVDLARLRVQDTPEPILERIFATRGGRRLRGLREAIERGCQRDPSTLPRRAENPEGRIQLSSTEQALQEIVRERRDKLAADLKIDATLILNRTQLAAICRKPESIDTVLQPWQAELVRPLLP